MPFDMQQSFKLLSKFLHGLSGSSCHNHPDHENLERREPMENLPSHSPPPPRRRLKSLPSTQQPHGGMPPHQHVSESLMIVSTVVKSKQQTGVDEFRKLRVLGVGSYGKVFLVKHKTTKKLYAMKVIPKDLLTERGAYRLRTERDVMAQCQHQFIVQLQHAFQDLHRVYMVMDFCPGGDLFFNLQPRARWTNITGQAKFLVAQILMALQHLHAHGVVWRDIKPENVLFDIDGYVKLADFGLSKTGVFSPVRGCATFCGSLPYLAPEVLLLASPSPACAVSPAGGPQQDDRQQQGSGGYYHPYPGGPLAAAAGGGAEGGGSGGPSGPQAGAGAVGAEYGTAVDYFAVGCLAHELLFGLPPFLAETPQQQLALVLARRFRPPAADKCPPALASFLAGLLERWPGLRLGARGPEEVRGHPYFRHVDWGKLLARRYQPFYVPDVPGLRARREGGEGGAAPVVGGGAYGACETGRLEGVLPPPEGAASGGGGKEGGPSPGDPGPRHLVTINVDSLVTNFESQFTRLPVHDDAVEEEKWGPVTVLMTPTAAAAPASALPPHQRSMKIKGPEHSPLSSTCSLATRNISSSSFMEDGCIIINDFDYKVQQ